MSMSPELSAADQELANAHVRAVAERSGSSFLRGMRVLPAARRQAMFAIYAFCREVDDIADEPGETAVKLAELGAWRDEVERLYAGRPATLTGQALVGPVGAYDLPKDEFLALIDGMEMDAREAMVAPTMAELVLYCRRVAGAVGMLSVRVFGADGPAARELAVVLGEAFQITNILRDLPEDAARGRLYLPRELLRRHGVAAREPEAVLADPGLAPVSAELGAIARARFARSRALLAQCDRRAVKPCILMMEVYVRVLARLQRRGWDKPRQPVRVSGPEKAWIALRYGLFSG